MNDLYNTSLCSLFIRAISAYVAKSSFFASYSILKSSFPPQMSHLYAQLFSMRFGLLQDLPRSDVWEKNLAFITYKCFCILFFSFATWPHSPKSSPHKIWLGMWVPLILAAYPSHHLLLFGVVIMDRSLACCRAGYFVLPFDVQYYPKTAKMETVTFFSCHEYVVRVSDQYRRVLAHV